MMRSEIRTLEDVERFEQTPAELRWRGKSTYELIGRTAKQFPDRPAIAFQASADLDAHTAVVRYSELIAKINQTANALYRAGLNPGATTALMLTNVPETHFAMWGAEALGIVAPVNHLLEAEALRKILMEARAEAVVVLGPSMEGGVWEKGLSIFDDLPDLKVIFQVNSNRAVAAKKSQTPGGIAVLDFQNAIAIQPSDRLQFSRVIKSSDIAAYFHTGGTTGTPKLAQHSHANQVHLASTLADFFGWDERLIVMCGLPLFHVNAVFCTGLNAFACGGQIVLMTPGGFRTPGVIENLWKLVEKHKVNFFSTVPTILASLLRQPVNDADLTSIDFVLCGAAPMAPEVFRQFERATGICVLEGYGMTEGTCVSSLNPVNGERRIGSIGLRFPYQQMKCVRLDEAGNYLRDCQINEQGVVVFEGPNVFSGYKQADKNEGSFVDGKWFNSGDLGRQDADGYFWLTGRAKDLIIRGGHNIDPKIIEDILSLHPAVALVAAIGQPDAYAGELPCAYLTLREDLSEKPPSTAELLSFVKRHIVERAAAPVHIEIMTELPITAVGKIFKPALRTRAIERVIGAAIREIATDITLQVVNDETRGVCVQVSLPQRWSNQKGMTAKRAALRNVIDQFAINYDIEE